MNDWIDEFEKEIEPVEEAKTPIKIPDHHDETKFVHHKHAQDGFPTCWGIDKIVKWKQMAADEEKPVVMLTRAFKDVTCPYCINIRNGGSGRFHAHKITTIPPSLQRRQKDDQLPTASTSVVFGREQRKRRMKAAP